MAIAKPSGSTGLNGSCASVTGDLKSCFPTLLEYLQDTTYEGGAARQTACLTVFVETGLVKLCLNDRDTGRTAWTTAPSLEEALLALEGRLADGTADWRTVGSTRSGKGRK